MRKLTTKFGTLYIEEPTDNRADENRYVIEDSKHRWFDYFSTECVEESWGDYETFYQCLQNEFSELKTPDDLLDYLGIDAYTASQRWEDLLEDAYGEGEYFWDEKAQTYYTKTEDGQTITITEETILDNEYVNVVGNWYILVCD
jgi:hypothetical protein